MHFEEFHSDIQSEHQPAPLGVSDIEAVEALVSMTKQWKTTSFKPKPLRPLSPSSDCSEDDSSPHRCNGSRETLFVSENVMLGTRSLVLLSLLCYLHVIANVVELFLP